MTSLITTGFANRGLARGLGLVALVLVVASSNTRAGRG
jgi:hypothetical protein